jgi:hypothetical protein
MFSISRDSSIVDLPSPVAVCCHDAGGANLIAAWVSAEPLREWRLCADGPARKIFSSAAPQLPALGLERALGGAGSVLTGSGWASDLEHRARIAARRAGLPVIAVLDHWVNYRMRFVRGEEESLPDVFVVTDPEAERLAAETFLDARPIVRWENLYLRREAAEVARLAREREPAAGPRLLVTLEPLRGESSTQSGTLPEYVALDFLMEHLDTVFPAAADVSIRLRPHPSEPGDKYRAWLERRDLERGDLQGREPGLRARIELSPGGSLAQDLAWSDAVAGLHSYALIVALESKRRALCYLPPGAPPCALKDARLEQLRELIPRAA